MYKNVGCLIIHGFGGNVGDVKFLAEYLNSKGFDVLCPSLKGHTGRKKDLIGVVYTDWIKSAEEGLVNMKGKSKKIFIAGFSMGGLIGINLCEKYDIDGLITLNTPIYCWDMKKILCNIIDDIKNKKNNNIKRYWLSFKKYPACALCNFGKILNITKPKINKIQCPIFVVQSFDDDIVRKKSAKYIFDNISSKKKELKYYENSGHVILKSSSAKEVSKDVENFFIGL